MIAVYTLFDLVSSCPIFFVINFEQEEAVAQTCSVKKVFLDISQNFEFCEISKNTFFYRTPLAAASGCSSFLVFVLLSPKVLFID